MGRISTGIGLVSGINSKDIIDQLMAIESRPKDTLQTRIDSITQQKLAYTDLQTRLTSLKLSGTTLSSPHNLPLNGNTSGGNSVTIVCPANHAAIGFVGRYGHNSTYDEDVTTSLGLVCKNLTSTATQIVSITTQPALDSGYTSFREDCTGGRFLTDIAGLPDSNSLAYCVGQIGGECNVR